MLKGIDPLLSADLLWALASMGHGDEIALVDANHPAARLAAEAGGPRLIRLPGIPLQRVAAAILSVLPIDRDEPCALRRMAVPGEVTPPAVQREVMDAVRAAFPDLGEVGVLERYEFYAQARKAFAIVQSGDRRAYGCFLLRKGVINGAADAG
jgi:L-fucose mutarotase